MIGEIVINGKSSKDFDVYLSDAGIYGMPERDSTNIEVDGRNGDLVIDNGKYKNKKVTFPCLIVDNFRENFEAFIGYLLSQKGYVRIEDSFKPEEYILGRFIEEVDPKTTDYAEKGSFEITFDRKPQRFIKEGEYPITLTADGSIFNNYNGEALPLVRVYGTGALSISSTTITINSVNEYVDIDCELQDAYKGASNCNGNITLNSDRFFSLPSGVNNIDLSGSISRVEITPRWWKL